jgi:hypothetical protein
MPKKIISDLIVTKKSIRQIPVSKEMKNRIEHETQIENQKRKDLHLPKNGHPPGWQRKPLNPKFVIWLIAGICVLALFFGVSILFSSATLIITPRVENISFSNEPFTAKLNSANTSDLSYEILSVEQSANDTVSATKEKDVSQKASGKIIIYNNYSTAPQRLINNTRFESANGKMYRINSSVIIPGLTKVNGKIVPGSIEAVLFADQPGEEYNMKLSDLAGDFKIPGFKGDPRYDKFYGRLKEDIQNGFVGKQRIVADDLRKTTVDSLKIKIKEQLLKEFYAVKPDNYFVFPDTHSIDYTLLPDTAVGSDKVMINMKGNLNGLVFNKNKLAKYLASKKLEDFDGLQVDFIPRDDLVAVLTGADTTALYKNTSLQIKLTGNVTIKWLYDSLSIKKDLAGKKESDLKNLVSKYKDTVLGIKVIFRPVWTRYFPDDLEKIRITEEVK